MNENNTGFDNGVNDADEEFDVNEVLVEEKFNSEESDEVEFESACQPCRDEEIKDEAAAKVQLASVLSRIADAKLGNKILLTHQDLKDSAGSGPYAQTIKKLIELATKQVLAGDTRKQRDLYEGTFQVGSLSLDASAGDGDDGFNFGDVCGAKANRAGKSIYKGHGDTSRGEAKKVRKIIKDKEVAARKNALVIDPREEKIHTAFVAENDQMDSAEFFLVTAACHQAATRPVTELGMKTSWNIIKKLSDSLLGNLDEVGKLVKICADDAKKWLPKIDKAREIAKHERDSVWSELFLLGELE